MTNNIPKGFAEIVKKTLSSFLKPSSRGRKGYDKSLMFQWLMYKQVMGCSYRDLESLTGIDYSTFIKFRKRLILADWFEKIFKKLVAQIASALDLITVILDSSFVETYSKHDEAGSEYSGYKQKNGFKLHQMIDYKSRLPLLQLCTPGARADVVWGGNLVRAAPKDWKVKEVLADKGYDAEQFVHDIKLKWKKVKVGIPLRRLVYPGNWLNQFIRRWSRSLNPSLLSKRTEIERYFSRKKHVFKLGEERTRHLKNFQANCCLISIMEILEWMVKILVLFTKLLLSYKHYGIFRVMKKSLSSKLNLNVVFRAEPEGGFTVLVPALPGCITYGKNIKEAQRMAEEAINLYLEDMAENGEELPRNEQTYLGNIEVTLPSVSSHV